MLYDVLMGISLYPDLSSKLHDLHLQRKNSHLRNVVNDENRIRSMIVEAAGIKLDFSKNLVDDEILNSLFELARQAQVEQWRSKMFVGEKINFTERRAVLHTALRNHEAEELIVDGVDVKAQVQEVLEKMKNFSEKVRNGEWLGATGKRIEHIINIGIGGSDLGPRMVCEALKPWGMGNLSMHFVSNVDSNDLYEVLNKIDWETSLFVIASKTFTTQETMTNAKLAREWFITRGGSEEAVSKHFVAVSTNLKGVEDFGINPDNAFGFWDWVGGRYSVWGAIGLPVMIYVGFENFQEFLNGGFEMDQHFKTASLENNLPVILAWLGIWYRNFLNSPTLAVIPYDQRLIHLPRYLQQLDMESNGKSYRRDGIKVDYETGPIILGEIGTNSQHSFFQLIHQGTSVLPVDFILAEQSVGGNEESHRMVRANCIAQGMALAVGKTQEESYDQMIGKGMSNEEAKRLAPFKSYEGNRPSNLIQVYQMTPRVLGSLIAMYEHKVFVQGIIWQINSFDQMGVELGKELAGKMG